MKIGFYYHISLYKKNNNLHIPSYLGVFLDSLAKLSDKLIIFAHQASDSDRLNCDYILKESNIEWINLGFKKPFWHRVLFPEKVFKLIKSQAAKCDKIIVRAPSPLAPYFYSKLGNKSIVAYLMVGDYLEGLKVQKDPLYRKIPIFILTYWNSMLQNRAIRNCPTFVNSYLLYEKYKGFAKNIELVKTTTLSKSDFFERTDSFDKDSNLINILFTGRISASKGVYDILNVVLQLKENKKDIKLHYVGWEDNITKPIENDIIRISREHAIEDSVIFHGKKAVGPELFEMYRRAQIYILPSQSNFEGFPRTIWEAMANSLPVVATRVGSIPYYLENEKHILMVPPQDSNALYEAVNRIINNEKLRKDLILNSYEYVKGVTLEKQTSMMLEKLQRIF